MMCVYNTIAGFPEKHCVDCQLENKGFVFLEADRASCCLAVLKQRTVSPNDVWGKVW